MAAVAVRVRGGRSWEDVRGELLRRIQTRDWRPGERVPGEQELAVEFGCARTTVNRAMRALADAGLVERRRKAGTRVVATPVRRATVDIPIIRREVENRGQVYRFAVVEHREKRFPAAIAARLGLAPGQTGLKLKTLHFGDDRPFAYEMRWLNPRAVPRFRRAELDRVSINEWLVANVPIKRGEIAFSAGNATTEEAEHLAIPVGTAVFVVERSTENDLGPVTWVRLVYGPGYRLFTTL